MEIKEQLFNFIEGYTDWIPDSKSTEFVLACIHEAIELFNRDEGTDYDPDDYQSYLEWKENEDNETEPR